MKARHGGRGIRLYGAGNELAYAHCLAAYPFNWAALGELELRLGRHETAREHFRAAHAVSRNAMERRFLEQRFGACESVDTK
jgi:predicted RNA polymerase sigma factor